MKEDLNGTKVMTPRNGRENIDRWWQDYEWIRERTNVRPRYQPQFFSYKGKQDLIDVILWPIPVSTVLVKLRSVLCCTWLPFQPSESCDRDHKRREECTYVELYCFPLCDIGINQGSNSQQQGVTFQDRAKAKYSTLIPMSEVGECRSPYTSTWRWWGVSYSLLWGVLINLGWWHRKSLASYTR